MQINDATIKAMESDVATILGNCRTNTRIKQFFDMFKRRRDKINAEDEKETPGEYRVKYTEEELNDFFFKELRDKYITYAKTKYPEAVGI